MNCKYRLKIARRFLTTYSSLDLRSSFEMKGSNLKNKNYLMTSIFVASIDDSCSAIKLNRVENELFTAILTLISASHSTLINIKK